MSSSHVKLPVLPKGHHAASWSGRGHSTLKRHLWSLFGNEAIERTDPRKLEFPQQSAVGKEIAKALGTSRGGLISCEEVCNFLDDLVEIGAETVTAEATPWLDCFVAHTFCFLYPRIWTPKLDLGVVVNASLCSPFHCGHFE